MYELMDPPVRAVQGGIVAYGLYKRSIPDLNLLDIDIFQRKRPTPVWLRRLRLKEWEHIAILARSFYLGIAVVDAKWLGLSWVCYFDRATHQMMEHTRRFFPSTIKIPPSLAPGGVSVHARSYSIDIQNRLNEGYHRIVMDIGASRKLSRFQAHLTMYERTGEVQPIIALLPIEEKRPFFTHKSPCPVEGEVVIGEKRFSLNPTSDVAVLDYHRTYFFSRTHWEWATFAGFDKRSVLIGVNLTKGILRRDELLNENGVWYAATLTPVGRADFRIPRDPLDLWHVKTDDGAVDVTFKPLGHRSEQISLGPLRSRYVQPFGLFSGKVRDGEGRIHTVEDMFGIAEDHTVTW